MNAIDAQTCLRGEDLIYTVLGLSGCFIRSARVF
jgi:hypothetical protein